jgi:S-adenosylmethionine hydrolase
MPTSRFLQTYLGPILLALLTWLPLAAQAAPHTVALFTDYGDEDPYVAQLKGAILTIAPDARLLDLTHAVTPYNLAEGAYLLDQAATEFPAGTIFVAVVDPQSTKETAPILLETAKEKFYVGPDNGLFTAVLAREGFLKAWKLDKPQFFRSPTAAPSRNSRGRDIYGPVAAHLDLGTDLDRLGTPLTAKDLTLLPLKEPTIVGSTVSAQILHIDHYGNVILNLAADSEAAAKFKEGNLVKISVGKESYSAPLVKSYGDIEKGRLILLYGGNGLLQVAVNQGSAGKQLKAEPGTVIFLKP